MKSRLLASAFLLLCLAACTLVQHSATVPLERNAQWAMLPIANYTDVPQAGLRAETIVETVLRGRHLGGFQHYPPVLNSDSLFEPAERKAVLEAMDWARKQGVRYAVTGAVDEWRYKVGIDGEPAVGLTLQVIDLANNNAVVWSAGGAKSGWSREALSGVARDLISDLLGDMKLQ
jgi:TolB-like protein